MSKWKNLEDLTKRLLECDSPKLPAGSGSGKGEEDVIGQTMIAQCKYTDNKNTSILDKDIERLLSSADMLEKFPLFVTQSSDRVMLSIPVDEETMPVIVHLIKAVRVFKGLRVLDDNLNYMRQNGSLAEIENAKRVYQKLKSTAKRLISSIRSRLSSSEQRADSLYDHLTMYDLFEGDQDATEQRAEEGTTEKDRRFQESTWT